MKNHRISAVPGNAKAFSPLLAFATFTILAAFASVISSCQHPDFSSLLDAGNRQSTDTTAITIHVNDQWAGTTNKCANE